MRKLGRGPFAEGGDRADAHHEAGEQGLCPPSH